MVKVVIYDDGKLVRDMEGDYVYGAVVQDLNNNECNINAFSLGVISSRNMIESAASSVVRIIENFNSDSFKQVFNLKLFEAQVIAQVRNRLMERKELHTETMFGKKGN